MTDPLEPRDLSHHAPATEPLSPAAQAVSDASHKAWVTKDDPWSIAAAALRAAADLGPSYELTTIEFDEGWGEAMDLLRTIAAELDGHHG